MEPEDQSVGQLVALGLARYEARVYLALIRRESYTAAEAAREADVPRQRIYDVLDALVRRRLAVAHPGRVATFSAADPELALARLMSEQREALERMERISTGLAGALLPVWSEGRSQSDPLDYIEVLRDPKAIAERFADIQEHVRYELLSFNKPPFVTPTVNTEGITAVHRLCRAQGEARAIYTYDVLDDPDITDNVQQFGQAGEQARFVQDLPLKFVIADASLVLCDMPDPVAGTGATTALFIEHPALAGCLRLAFQAVWSRSSTLEAIREARAAAG
ncbi:helix-turn-helix domain-containing protein [Streptomyces sp. SL13]|uniref:Helix-turn-helix domain-containing protein n=1 Tax=Streptantibioticus silvisoli TaxID=2705255 RepID=A0AA90KB70_9ACTN|nr:helix-turn-helix domain-containing protein [Streptantibioticus silvisoli]MDI5965290.1 helix-turn-helix domain-containing protein [Streptantibioticus silvisoli]MDI5972927.1 helix-turn-helix domain-containing protein [Streptantibioticus silvisoli]